MATIVGACGSHESTAPPEAKTAKSRAALVASTPEAPSILRPVHLVEHETGQAATFARPTLPMLRTSLDGRIGLDVKKRKGRVSFSLITPEKLPSHFWDAGATGALANTQSVILDGSGREGFDADLFYVKEKTVGSTTVHRSHDHATFCQAIESPHSCGAAYPNDDCYDLVVVSSISWDDPVSGDRMASLVSQPITVRVTNPKTASAAVSSLVVTGAQVEGPAFRANSFFEPMITADGRMIVGRLNSARVTLDGKTAATNIVYSVYDSAASPCDVGKWTTWHRISHAYADPLVHGRYGIGDWQLRDPEGNLIADGDELEGSYPWIDRKGNNLFFTWVRSTHYYTDASDVLHERYPSRCLDHDVVPAKPVTLDPLGFTGPMESLDATTPNYGSTPPKAAYTNQIPAAGDPICSEHMSLARDTCMPTGFDNRTSAAETAPDTAYLYGHLLWRICAASDDPYTCPTTPYVAPPADRFVTVKPYDTMTTSIPGMPAMETVCDATSTTLPCANHHVYKPDPAAARAPLFVMLPGTGMEPDKHDLVLRTAAFAGYRTIGLSYDNTLDMNSHCAGQTSCPGSCFTGARNEKIFGKGTCSLGADIKSSDAIAERLFRLLTHLHNQFPTEGWDAYILKPGVAVPSTSTCGTAQNDTGGCTPSVWFDRIAWDKIVIAGFSQGAGHAAKISRMREVEGLLMLDSDADTCDNAGAPPSPAEWITSTADASSCRPHLIMRHGHLCVNVVSKHNLATGDPANGADLVEYDDMTKGVSVVGRWTQNKIVMLDGLLNNGDFGLRRARQYHREVSLYVPTSGAITHDGWVRIATGRENTGGALPAGMTENTAFIDSFENLFHHESRIRPETVRDVVWLVNMGKATDEVVFDDFLDPNVIIHSDMMPSTSLVVPSGGTVPVRTYHDGFVETGAGKGTGFGAPVHVQNGATSRAWKVPAYGAVEGAARLEPVALGGIRGRGIWIDGVDDAVRYTWSTQSQPVGNLTVYAGMFLDPRFPNDAIERLLFTMPNGVRVFLVGRQTVRIAVGASNLAIVTLPGSGLPMQAFSHLGFEFAPTTTRTYLDGFLLHDSGLGINGYLGAGDFVLGADGGFAPVKGWVDELRVLVNARGPEISCNHARGTLIGLGPSAPTEWQQKAAQYPLAAHNEISAILAANGATQYPRYACLVDHKSDRVPRIPAGTASVRAGVLALPALQHATPRPATGGNAFCLSCHTSGNPVTSLSTSALAFNGIPLRADPRRQPSNPPQRILGVVPIGYVRQTGLPLSFQSSGNYPLDVWVYP